MPVIRATFDAVERDSDIGGGILAGALAYQIFLFLLPLGVVTVGVFGAVSAITGRTPHDLAQSAGIRGIVTTSISDAADSGWGYAIIIGSALLLYVARGLLRVLAGIHRLAWGLPARTQRPSFRVTLVFIIVMLLFFLATGAASVVRDHSAVGGLATTLAVGAVYTAGWLVVSLVLEHRGSQGEEGILHNPAWTSVVPGALLMGFGAEVLQAFYITAMSQLASGKQDAYGELGLAAALLFGLYLAGRLVIGAAVLNATLWEHRHGQTLT